MRRAVDIQDCAALYARLNSVSIWRIDSLKSTEGGVGDDAAHQV